MGIDTLTRQDIDLSNVRPEQIDIRDIAAGLAKEPRYNGQIPVFYSVAEHCVHVAQAAPRRFRLAALLHDASEAYMKDLPTPLKRRYPHYEADEQRLQAAIAKRFDLRFPWPDEVRQLDRRILLDEFKVFRPYDIWKVEQTSLQPLGVKIKCWDWQVAEIMFLELFEELRNGVRVPS